MRRAAGDFGVAPDSLAHKIIERGNPWAAGLKGSDARVLVDLPEGPGPFGRNGTGERLGGLRTEQPAPREPPAADLDARGGDDRDAGRCYAPEQAARLLGEDVQAVD